MSSGSLGKTCTFASASRWCYCRHFGSGWRTCRSWSSVRSYSSRSRANHMWRSSRRPWCARGPATCASCCARSPKRRAVPPAPSESAPSISTRAPGVRSPPRCSPEWREPRSEGPESGRKRALLQVRHPHRRGGRERRCGQDTRAGGGCGVPEDHRRAGAVRREPDPRGEATRGCRSARWSAGSPSTTWRGLASARSARARIARAPVIRLTRPSPVLRESLNAQASWDLTPHAG